jgi:hypothetical protein
MSMNQCGAKLVTRFPDAPSDDWETAVCIQEHDRIPAPVGTIHDSGDGTRWIEVDGFFERDGDSARDIIQNIIDYSDNADGLGTWKQADALVDEICAALGLPGREAQS